jgi:transposase
MENELRTNAVKLSAEAQYQLRRSTVRLWKAGKHPDEIAEALDIGRSTVYKTLKAYQAEGIKGIRPKRRGRTKGENHVLTPAQEKEIQRIIIEKNPEQMKLKCCLWTRKAIHDLIMRYYQIDIKNSTLGYYLQRWGFSIQRPIKRARKQDPEKVELWLTEHYPAIAEKAKVENAEIYWGDEAALQNTANYARGYAPKGKTPVLEVESKKLKLNLLSAISNRGKLRFTITKEPVNSDILIAFMKRLVRDVGRKVLLILDNLRVHHSKKVTAWLVQHHDEIEVFFLPPYSPEHNPDEYLNSSLKRDIGNKPMPGTEADLSHNARSSLKRHQLSPDKVRAFFRHPSVSYAA